MSCNCKLYIKKLEKLQKKHAALRKIHIKLLDVAVLLTEALEELMKGKVRTDLYDTLYSSIYSDVLHGEKATVQEAQDLKTGTKNLFIQVTDENGEGFDAVDGWEKENIDGFLARPRIPRTPQV